MRGEKVVSGDGSTDGDGELRTADGEVDVTGETMTDGAEDGNGDADVFFAFEDAVTGESGCCRFIQYAYIADGF